MELMAKTIHRNAFDGYGIGIVCLGDIISAGKLDQPGHIESHAIEYPTARRQLSEVVARVAVVRRGGGDLALVKGIQVDRMLSRAQVTPAKHRRNKSHHDSHGNQQCHQAALFHGEHC